MLTRNNARSLTNASIHRFKPSSMVTCKAYNNCTVCVHAYKAPPRTCSHSHTNTLTHAHTLRARRFLMEVGHLGDPKLVTFRTKGGPKCQTRFRSDPLCQCCCEFIRSNCGKRDTLSSERSNFGFAWRLAKSSRALHFSFDSSRYERKDVVSPCHSG